MANDGVVKSLKFSLLAQKNQHFSRKMLHRFKKVRIFTRFLLLSLQTNKNCKYE